MSQRRRPSAPAEFAGRGTPVAGPSNVHRAASPTASQPHAAQGGRPAEAQVASARHEVVMSVSQTSSDSQRRHLGCD